MTLISLDFRYKLVCVCVWFKIAPETLKGKMFDMPADLWSIGVITYIL